MKGTKNMLNASKKFAKVLSTITCGIVFSTTVHALPPKTAGQQNLPQAQPTEQQDDDYRLIVMADYRGPKKLKTFFNMGHEGKVVLFLGRVRDTEVELVYTKNGLRTVCRVICGDDIIRQVFETPKLLLTNPDYYRDYLAEPSVKRIYYDIKTTRKLAESILRQEDPDIVMLYNC